MSNEKRNRIEAKCDIHESKIIAGIKKGKNTTIKRERIQLLAKVRAQQTPKQYKKMSNTLDVRIQGRQKRPNECVCKEKGARV